MIAQLFEYTTGATLLTVTTSWLAYHPKRNYKPADLATVRKMFPGFEVGPGDFGHAGGEFCRINSDGYPMPLKRWRLDHNTGEFHRVVRRHSAGELRDQRPYGPRVVKWTEHRWSRAIAQPLALWIVLLVALGLPVLAAEGFQRDLGGGLMVSFFAALALAAAVFCVLWVIRDNDPRRNVGPQPLRRIAENFGPAATSKAPIAAAPPADDLAYKPTL